MKDFSKTCHWKLNDRIKSGSIIYKNWVFLLARQSAEDIKDALKNYPSYYWIEHIHSFKDIKYSVNVTYRESYFEKEGHCEYCEAKAPIELAEKAKKLALIKSRIS